MININDIIFALRIIDVLKSGRNSPLFTLILCILFCGILCIRYLALGKINIVWEVIMWQIT